MQKSIWLMKSEEFMSEKLFTDWKEKKNIKTHIIQLKVMTCLSAYIHFAVYLYSNWTASVFTKSLYFVQN